MNTFLKLIFLSLFFVIILTPDIQAGELVNCVKKQNYDQEVQREYSSILTLQSKIQCDSGISGVLLSVYHGLQIGAGYCEECVQCIELSKVLLRKINMSQSKAKKMCIGTAYERSALNITISNQIEMLKSGQP